MGLKLELKKYFWIEIQYVNYILRIHIFTQKNTTTSSVYDLSSVFLLTEKGFYW